MNPPNHNHRSRIGLASLTVLAVAAGLVGYAGAQEGPSSNCRGAVTTFGSSFFGTDDAGNRLYSTGTTSREFALSAPLPAGTYDVDAEAYDGYDGRETTPAQPFEQWFAEFLGEDGAVVATTSATGDVADGVTEASWSGSIGRIELSEIANSVRIVHAAIGDSNSNSVRPVCIGAVEVDTTPPPSSVAVNFESDESTPVGLDCGNNRVDGATGQIVELYIGELEPDTNCLVTFNDGTSTCDVAITDNAARTGFQDLDLMVGVPSTGGVDIIVDIDCVTAPVTTEPETPVTTDAPVTTTTQPPAVVAAPTTTAAPVVKAATEVATPIDMNPAFTG